jgi:hypothetical protein
VIVELVTPGPEMLDGQPPPDGVLEFWFVLVLLFEFELLFEFVLVLVLVFELLLGFVTFEFELLLSFGLELFELGLLSVVVLGLLESVEVLELPLLLRMAFEAALRTSDGTRAPQAVPMRPRVRKMATARGVRMGLLCLI